MPVYTTHNEHSRIGAVTCIGSTVESYPRATSTQVGFHDTTRVRQGWLHESPPGRPHGTWHFCASQVKPGHFTKTQKHRAVSQVQNKTAQAMPITKCMI